MREKIALRKLDERNVHSQFGEDGIIDRIFSSLQIRNGTAVEFGAWDGVHLSNTANLRNQGWTTILIEADDDRIDQLRKLQDARTIAIAAHIEPEGPQSVDAILQGIGISEVDFIAIDIDGDDLNILKSMALRPKVICIEFNPAIIPPHVFENPLGSCKGSSLSAICQTAKSKDYELVYATYCNAFFVRRPEAAVFTCRNVFDAFYSIERPAIFCMFDGEFRVGGSSSDALYRHPWSTVPIYIPRLPSFLLSWPPTSSRVAAAYFYCAIAAPFFYIYALFSAGGRILRQRLKNVR